MLNCFIARLALLTTQNILALFAAGTEGIAPLSTQETAALRDFEPVYVADESKLEKFALSVTSLLEARGERSSRMSQRAEPIIMCFAGDDWPDWLDFPNCLVSQSCKGVKWRCNGAKC